MLSFGNITVAFSIKCKDRPIVGIGVEATIVGIGVEATIVGIGLID